MPFIFPPEPAFKDQWRKELDKGGGKLNLIRANIKQGTWLTTSLWNDFGWKNDLKEKGITWQKFMALYRDSYHYFLGWVEGNISWKQALVGLVREIEQIAQAKSER